MSSKIVMGVDPGSLVTGYGLLEVSSTGYRAVEYGVIRTSSSTSFPLRLRKIYQSLDDLLARFCPNEIAVEDIFYAENVKSALKMGHARGVALLVGAIHDLGVFEYSPREVKLSVTGNGGASKHQVRHAVQLLLSLDSEPKNFDVTDALAVAICHCHRHQN